MNRCFSAKLQSFALEDKPVARMQHRLQEPFQPSQVKLGAFLMVVNWSTFIRWRKFISHSSCVDLIVVGLRRWLGETARPVNSLRKAHSSASAATAALAGEAR